MQYSIKIDAFEGPLDLLLHLIQKLEIDIYDIPVSEITKQYMDYIHTMQELRLDVASEYLVMAASLLEIKSRMLLPKHEEIDDEFDEEPEFDPREELVSRLIEYRKFKEAAEILKERENDHGVLFNRLPEMKELSSENGETKPYVNVSIYEMILAFQLLLDKNKDTVPKRTTIARDEVSIESKINEIVLKLKSRTGWQRFTELFSDEDRESIVVTFLAVLELIKYDQIICVQKQNFSDILLKYSKAGKD